MSALQLEYGNSALVGDLSLTFSYVSRATSARELCFVGVTFLSPFCNPLFGLGGCDLSSRKFVDSISESMVLVRNRILCPSSGKRLYGSSCGGKWNRTTNKMYSNSRQQVGPIFTATSAVSRGLLKRRSRKSTNHINRGFINTQSMLQAIKYMNQLSFSAAVTKWCYILLYRGKFFTLGTLACVELEEVSMLISLGGRKLHDAECGKIQSIRKGLHDPIV